MLMVKMKRSLLLTVFFLAFLVSCTTSRSTVSANADLSKYQYAAVVDVVSDQSSATMVEAEVKIFDALDESRLQLVGAHRIDELTDAQKDALLLVRFGVTQTEEEAVVSANFVDYMTVRPVASCRGAFGLALDYEGDFNGALKRVAQQIVKTFPKQ